MPIISDSDYCIDRRKLEFSLIEKNIYKDELFNGKLQKLKRKLNPYFKNFIFLRRLVQVEMGDTCKWEIYPKGKKKYIFICVAKVASSSINKILNHYLHPEPIFHHMSIQELENYYLDLDINSFYKFAFVRNPWERFISLYNDMTFQRNGQKKLMNYSLLEKKKNSIFYKTKNFKEFAKSFESSNWINEAHFKPQFDFLSKNGELVMDFIGRFENLNSDWEKIKNDIGLNYLGEIGHQRKSNKNLCNYKEFYDNETIDIVSRIYKKDIQIFNYDF